MGDSGFSLVCLLVVDGGRSSHKVGRSCRKCAENVAYELHITTGCGVCVPRANRSVLGKLHNAQCTMHT